MTDKKNTYQKIKQGKSRKYINNYLYIIGV